MSVSSSTRRSRLAGLLLVALVAPGCVQPDEPGVQVRALSADLVFGVPEEAPREAAPPNTIVLTQPTQSVAPPGPPPQAPPPPPPAFSPPPPTFTGPPLAENVTCPPAPVTEFPDEAAARNVAPDRRPAVGDYRWVREGTRVLPTAPDVEIPVEGFEQRQLRNVTEVSDNEFTFETVQTDLVTSDTVITTWNVRTEGTSVSRDDVPVQVVPSPEPPQQSAGEPDRGIAIAKIVRVDGDGNESTFAPVTPLLILPLPVRVNEEFTSTAVDPTTFQSMQYEAKVSQATRVDACGELVEGWLVTGTQTISGASNARRQYDVILAPQLGGIPIAEHVAQSAGIDGSVDVDFRIGQLEPDPLPEAEDE